MPTPTVAQRIGWPSSYSDRPLKKLLAGIRPEYRGIDPVDRVTYEPGVLTQCDLWFPEPRIPVGPGQLRVLPVLVMTLAFSRFTVAMMIPSRRAGDILSGMWALISGVGRVIKTLLWDRDAAIGGTGRVSVPAAAFAGTLATRIRLAPPRDPEFKGWSSATTDTWRPRFCPAEGSPRRRLQRAADRVARPSQRPHRAGDPGPAGRSARGRLPVDAGPAADRSVRGRELSPRGWLRPPPERASWIWVGRP